MGKEFPEFQQRARASPAKQIPVCEAGSSFYREQPSYSHMFNKNTSKIDPKLKASQDLLQKERFGENLDHTKTTVQKVTKDMYQRTGVDAP